MNKLPFEETKREVLVKKEGDTDSKCRDKRDTKTMINYGIVVINKPQGPTSHQVTAFVKSILEIRHAGHGGTLDPNVTGVLPIALGRATRIVQALLKAGKEYVCLMHIHKDVSEEKIRQVMNEFIGKIKQIPPLKSAVKRRERERKVYYLEILEIERRDVLFRIGCEAGTYVRKLCDDVGKKLGSGAHMAELIRTKAGPFTDKEWNSLHDLKDAYEYYKEGNEEELKKIILPVERGVEYLAKIWVFDNAVDSICHGADLSLPGVSKLHSGIQEGDLIAVMTLKDELICLGKALKNSNEMLKEGRGKAVKTKKVFMERGIYPKFVKN